MNSKDNIVNVTPPIPKLSDCHSIFDGDTDNQKHAKQYLKSLKSCVVITSKPNKYNSMQEPSSG